MSEHHALDRTVRPLHRPMRQRQCQRLRQSFRYRLRQRPERAWLRQKARERPGEAQQPGGAQQPGEAQRPRARLESCVSRSQRVRALAASGRDAGMATAEYAIATIAAVGFAGLLITVLKSGTVKGLLSGIIQSALSIG